mgnify:CR=1 FL=1
MEEPGITSRQDQAQTRPDTGSDASGRALSTAEPTADDARAAPLHQRLYRQLVRGLRRFAAPLLTPQNRQRQSLSRSEERLRLALEGSREALWDWDTQLKTAWFSPRWQQIIGFSDAQMRTYQWAEHIHPEDIEALHAQVNRLYGETLDYLHVICRHRYHSGGETGWKWIEARAACQRDAHGRVRRIAGHLRDIDAEQRAKLALRQSEMRMAEAQRVAHFGDWLLDIRSGELQWSEQTRVLLGVTPQVRPSPQLLLRLVHPEDRQRLRRLRRRVMAGECDYDIEYRIRSDDGDIRWLHSIARAEYDAEGRLLRLIGVLQEITQRRSTEHALRRSDKRLREAIEALEEGFALWDANDQLVMCNRRYRELYAEIDELIAPGATFTELLQASLQHGAVVLEGEAPQSWLARVRELHREGGVREHQLASGSLLRITERRTAEGGTVSVHSDITELRSAVGEVRRLAYYDDLTALPNRALFRRQLLDATRRARRSGRPLALLFLDLDRFKNINDSLGHAAGDELLRLTAQRLREALRDSDTVARLGGDEFTILLPDLASRDSATRIAEHLLQVLGRAYRLGEHSVYAEASIGITLCPEQGTEPEALLRQADMAMYAAKQRGRNTLAYFTAELTERAQHFLRAESELRQALAERALRIHYQPVVELASGRIAGAEALARWPDGDGGLHDTEQMISVAEETGLIDDLGERVLSDALAACRDWRSSDGGPLHLAVNLSGRQLRSGFDATRLAGLLAKYDFPAQQLVLEITESTFLEHSQSTLQNLQELRELGARLALDDFGTGYSALGYLRRYPVDLIKIDHSFVSGMHVDDGHRALVEAIIAMAQGLKLQVVAEGIETTAQAADLAQLGCLWGQGYHFSPALPADQFHARLLCTDNP